MDHVPPGYVPRPGNPVRTPPPRNPFMPKLPRFHPFLVASALFTLAVVPAPAQERVEFPAPSPRAVLKQRVGVTDVEVDYSRPGAKGRPVFGGLVPFGEVWRTGANASTKISFSEPVKIGDKEVPAGKYALYTIPTANEWTVILHKDTTLWGATKYNVANDLLRVTARPVALAERLETFTIELNDLRDDSATLLLAWDRVAVPVKISMNTVAQMSARIAAATAPDAKPQPPAFLAQAANFYLEHDKDLPQALRWVDQGVAANPKAWWLMNTKAKIQAKLGDKAGAIATAQQSIEANRASGEDADADAVEVAQKLIESLR